MKEYLIGFLIGAVAVFGTVLVLLPGQPQILQQLGSQQEEYSFARGTATSTTVLTASTQVFATSTQLIYRAIFNDSANTKYCAVGQAAVIGKGIIIYPSSTVVFGASANAGDRVVPTTGTVTCIAGTAGSVSTLVQQ